MIEQMSNDEVLVELKIKKLPTFGTTQERKERLKKALGIEIHTADPPIKRSNTLNKIEEMNKKREERRKKMEECKKQKLEKEAINEANGIMVDVDFDDMVTKYKLNLKKAEPHSLSDKLKIIVCVRKRPIFPKELTNGELDCVSCANPSIVVHECRLKVDGITKFLDNHDYNFDNVFNEKESSDDFYHYSLKPLIPSLFTNNIVTCFAYGQTGSGKTYTMVDVQRLAICDLFSYAENEFPQGTVTFGLSYFEIYMDKLLDLLNNKKICTALEDKNHFIQIQGLTECSVSSPTEMINAMDFANHERKTCATSSNDTSSRSHAICHINIYCQKKSIGKLSIVDLAGSERAYDCQSNEKQRQMEGAEINKSLLSLKECIRAINDKATHVPFRSSKLTMVLRDSFIGPSDKIKIVMIACVTPGNSAADHTLNTLKYADRLNEKGESAINNKANMPDKCKYDERPVEKVERVERIERPPERVIEQHQQPVAECSQKENEFEGVMEMDELVESNDFNERNDTQMEKMEELCKKQEEVNNQGGEFMTFHSRCVKEDAMMLNEESSMISGFNSENFDFTNYMGKMRGIIAKKLEHYSNLSTKLEHVSKLIEEEEFLRKNINN